MLLDRYVSEHENSVSVIVKHVKHSGTIWVFCLPGEDLLSFILSGRT